MLRRGRTAVASAVVLVAAGAAVLAMLVVGGDGPASSPSGNGEEQSDVAFVAANCDRFGQAAFPDRLRRPTNLRAGPITFSSLGEYAGEPVSTFEPVEQTWLHEPWVRPHVDASLRQAVREGSLYVALKVIVLIEGWRDVTVAIPTSHQPHAAMLWGPQPGVTRSEDRLGVREISDGNPIVRFKGCRDKVMEYVGGGFVVAGKRCLPLDIHVEGTQVPLRITASFGEDDRCTHTSVEH
jgi:hypothetical protein